MQRLPLPQALEYPDPATPKMTPPKPRTENQEAGLTCASCHTPDGKIRGPYDVNAPHATVRTSTSDAIPSPAHTAIRMAKRVVSKADVSFLEWREDYYKAGLGTQQCQDCHMPKTERKLAENFDVLRARGGQAPVDGRTFAPADRERAEPHDRAGERGTFATHAARDQRGGRTFGADRLRTRRAIYLVAEVVDTDKRHGEPRMDVRPMVRQSADDKKFVEEDKKGPEPVAETQADRQGPRDGHPCG